MSNNFFFCRKPLFYLAKLYNKIKEKKIMIRVDYLINKIIEDVTLASMSLDTTNKKRVTK